MMILNAYSIYDLKAVQYHAPFFAVTDAAAARAFGDLANDPQTTVGRHPADYILYCVGTFNDTNGALDAIAPRRHVADGSSYFQKHGDLFAQPLANGGADLASTTKE